MKKIFFFTFFLLATICLESTSFAQGCMLSSGTGTAPNVCIGNILSLSSSISNPSETWTSSATGIATVAGTGGAGSGTADVTGVTSGTVTITYDHDGTGATTCTYVVTVTPVAAPISGTVNVCVGSSYGFTTSVGGGYWTSTNPSRATVNSASGVVTGVSAGGCSIRYTLVNAGCTTQTSLNITVRALPTVNVVTGTASLCEAGGTTTLSNATLGGVWSSASPTIGTVDPVSGVVTGLTDGTTVISYTVTNGFGCQNTATVNVTVNPLPTPSISGSSYVCHLGTPTVGLTPSPGTGGTWSSTNPSSGTVNSSGVVTGLLAGTMVIEYLYTDANGCSDVATHPMTVEPTPVAGTVTGTFKVCRGATTALGLTGADPGGVWSSAHNPTATVGSTGIVTGNSAGVVDISYTVTNSCGPVSAVASVTVNALPNAGTVLNTSICLGGSPWNATSDGDGGGVWTSDNTGIATVGSSSGTVTGVSAGATLITYTVTNASGCIAYTTCTVTVDVPVTLSPISGASTVCVGATTPYTNSHTPGSWSSDDDGVATVNSSTGVVTGVAAGITTITFTTANSCGVYYVTKAITVNPIPDAGDISGTTPLCYIGSNTYASDGDPGGVWTSSNTGVATVGSSSGTVNGVSGGTATITYTVTNGYGCPAYSTKAVTIDPAPIAGTITGTFTAICTTTLSVTGNNAPGTWSSDNTAVATVGSLNGFVYGVTASSTTITYTATNTCGSTYTVQAISTNAMPNPGTITGTFNVCVGNNRTLGSTGDAGGVWTSYAPAIATVGSSSGVMTGVIASITIISYTVTNGCGSAFTTRDVTVNPLPDAGIMTGPDIACKPSTPVGFVAALGDVGGVWSSANTAIGSVVGTGSVNANVTGVSVGTTTISYTVTTAFGCTDVTYKDIEVIDQPIPGTITGSANVCPAAVTTYTATCGSCGLWSSSNTAVATIGTGTGILTAVSSGSVNITYTTYDDRCPIIYTVQAVTVKTAPVLNTITGTYTTLNSGGSPNPNNGNYSITYVGGSVSGTAAYSWSVSSPTYLTIVSGGTTSTVNIALVSTGATTPIYCTVTDGGAGGSGCSTLSSGFSITTAP